MNKVTDNDRNPELIAYVAGEMSDECAANIERAANDDREISSQITLMHAVTETYFQQKTTQFSEVDRSVGFQRWLLKRRKAVAVAAGLLLIAFLSGVFYYNSLPSQYEAAVVAFENGKYDEAIRLLDQFIDANPKSSPAWLLRGRVYAKKGNIEEDNHFHDSSPFMPRYRRMHVNTTRRSHEKPL